MEKRKTKYVYLEIFLVSFIIAMSFILPYIILDKGIFIFYGDYNVQQIPFYMLAHRAIRSGSIYWNWTTDLGANFIGSYAFYLLGSPFFWLTIPLPQAAVPYTLGPLLALKIATATLTSYFYFKRFIKSHEIAVIGGLLYAFSGFSIYNIFFNHFHEPIAFFPLLLIGLEEFMKDDRKGLFAVTVFINAFVNYVFFFGEVVFLLIYWIVRMMSGDWKLTPKKFAFLGFEAVIGVGMSFVLLYPAVLQTAANNRTKQYLNGWGLFLYDTPQRYGDIIHSLFFPQDLPSRPNFFPDANNKWASMSAFLPMFSLSGVLAFVMARRGNWLRRILCFSLVMALVPGLNSLFVALNQEYYCRWYYMPVLLMCLATCAALEDPDIDFGRGLNWTAAITIIIAACIGFAPKMTNGKLSGFGLEAYPARFWVYVIISILGLLLVYILYLLYGKNSNAFLNYATIGLTVIVCIYANFFVATGKEYSDPDDWYKSVAVEGEQKLHLDKSTFYRVDVLNGMDNQAMFWNLPNIQAFQSVVPESIMEFYPTVNVTRDVASRPDFSISGLRPFLSVKYLFDKDNSTRLSAPGWVSKGYQLGFKIWENTNYIPMGFTYDSYMTRPQYDISANRDRLLLKAILLTQDQIKKYGKLLTPLQDTGEIGYGDLTMAEDCAARRAGACSSFSYDKTGFNAAITLKKTNLVFFSVPYDGGWSATVNGKPAKIEKVNVGFMAVECPAGTSHIRFEYRTPGLATGIVVSAASIAIFIAYVMIFRKRKRAKVKALLPVPQPVNEPEQQNQESGDSDDTLGN